MTVVSTSSSAKTTGSDVLRLWTVTGFFLLFLLAAVSASSFWIDEVGTAVKASQPTIGKWWHIISADKETDLQMPFYSIYIWAISKWVGIGEWPLRFFSALWLVPGLVAFVLSFPPKTRRLAAMLVLTTNAFLWYYANEARSYAMQLGGSCMVFGAIHRLARRDMPGEKEQRWLWVFACGMLILCGSSLLCMIWASAALFAIWLLFPVESLRAWWRKNQSLWILLTVFLAALGGFYVWTVAGGSRGSAVGSTNWRTTLFIIYDQCGFGGLGPGRTELRADGISALKPYAPLLAAYAVLLGILIFSGLKQFWQKDPRKTLGVATAIAAPWIFLSIVGVITHFRLLGRHCAPLACVWLFLVATGVAAIAKNPGWLGKSVSFLFLSLGLISSLSVRFAYRQGKDDYRRAAAVATEALAAHQIVWWNANEDCARYYRVPITESGSPSTHALLLFNPPNDRIALLKQPDIIIASKPDLFDTSGSVGAYVADHGFRLAASFPAFKVWQAPTPR